MAITVEDAHISTEIIMDGKTLHANLRRLGLDMIWLNKQLDEQGYKSAKEIFLGVCDENNQLTLFEK